jgi:hypothetical protein
MKVAGQSAISCSWDSRAVIKIDCAEFQHSHEIAKLIGFASRISHRGTIRLLGQEVLNQYHHGQVI